MGKDLIPILGDDTIYSEWKNEINLWQAATSLAEEKQAPNIVLNMRGNVRKVATKIKLDDLKAKDGVTKLLEALDKIYLKDNVQSLFVAIDQFEKFLRPKTMGIDEYISEFTRLNGIVTECRDNKPGYEDGILAYRLLHQANLTNEEQRLVRATTTELTFGKMQETLKRTFGDALGKNGFGRPGSNSPSCSYSHDPGPSIKQEPTFYQNVASSGDDEDWNQDEMYYQYDQGMEFCTDDQNQAEHVENVLQEDGSMTDDSSDKVFFNGSYYKKIPNKHHFKQRSFGNYSQRPFYKPRSNPYGNRYQQRPVGPRTYRPPVAVQGPLQLRPPAMKKGIENITCHGCGEKGHYARDCPKQEGNKFNFFQSEFEFEDCPGPDSSLIYLMGETANKAVLDTGASSTVCGKKWYQIYEDSLTPSEKDQISTLSESKSFRFGDGKAVVSVTKKRIPVNLCGQDIYLDTHVVDNDIPLLLSGESMRKMKMNIEIENDRITAFGGEETLITTKSGHMVIPIGRCTEKKTVENISYFVNTDDPVKCAQHLHRYFAHGSARRIGEFVNTTTLPNKKNIVDALKDIDKTCDFCIRHKTKEAPHRSVSMPVGETFNDVVAMDLKLLDCGEWIIHMLDTVTRFSSAATIDNKSADEIITKIFERWIAIFGKPQTFMSDNGSEFVNEKFNDLCSHMDIHIRTSPSESPWCNGAVERHNGLLADMINAVKEETGCSTDIAVAWAVNSKNSLNNVFGFSSHQLVFGKNPEVPGILTYRNLPALSETTVSKIVADNLNAMESARKNFISLENDRKLRRALTERVSERNNAQFYSGDVVYYKRQNQKGSWNGPATVVGQLANNVLIKHGGSLIRIHPCKIVLKSSADDQLNGIIDKSQDNPKTNGQFNNRALKNIEPSFVARPYIEKSNSENLCESSDDETSSDEDDPVIVPTVDQSAQITTDNITESQPCVEQDITTVSQPCVDQEWKAVKSIKSRDIIRYRASDNDEWNNGLVLGRAGKATGKNSSLYNIQIENEEEVNQLDVEKCQIEKLIETPNATDIQSVMYMEDNKVEVICYGSSLPDDQEVKKAKDLELKKFREYNVYTEVKNVGQSKISCRWVITKKGNDVKARLVARGFEEMLTDRVDAPTVNPTSLWLFFSICASNSWNAESFDITSAFLQANDIDREVFINPPPDARKNGILWKLLKPMYGLGDSSRQWYFTLREHLLNVGCVVSKLDKTVFRYYDNGKLAGILVTHVDDVLHAGNTKFNDVIVKTMFSKFKISRQYKDSFIYLGLNVEQDKAAGIITVDQESYAKNIKPINISASRRKALDECLTEEEQESYQSTLGKLLWLCGRTRPELSYDATELSTFVKSPKIKDLITMNKTVKQISESPSRLIFRAMDLKTDAIKVAVYSDAGLGNLPNNNSSRGILTFLGNQEGTVNLVSWSSNKIKRVVHSAFAAETLGCTDGFADVIYTRQLLNEILFNDPYSRMIPAFSFVDNMQLFDQILSTKQSSDKRMRLDISELQDSVKSGEIENVVWVPTEEMLADCLTKRGADNTKLRLVLESGFCRNIMTLRNSQ